MQDRFCQITTFGALMRFAMELEGAAAELLELTLSSGLKAAAHLPLAKMVKEHRKRSDKLERTRREKLNEVILEPLSDLVHTDYIGPFANVDEKQGFTNGETVVQDLLNMEQAISAFYADAGGLEQSPEVAKILKQMGKELEKMTKSFK